MHIHHLHHLLLVLCKVEVARLTFNHTHVTSTQQNVKVANLQVTNSEMKVKNNAQDVQIASLQVTNNEMNVEIANLKVGCRLFLTLLSVP